MKALSIVLTLFPVILSAVKAVEDAIPLPGAGKQKLDLVLNVVKQAFDASADLSHAFSWDKLVALVVPMIANIVSLHNQLGLFNTSAPAKA
jgi:hypothetical protein